MIGKSLVNKKNIKRRLTKIIAQELRAAIPQRIIGVVNGRRRARPAPGHAATEHPASHHRDAVRARTTLTPHTHAHAHLITIRHFTAAIIAPHVTTYQHPYVLRFGTL